MDYKTFEQSISIGLIFAKPTVKSVILNIDDAGITYSIGENGGSKKVSFDLLEAAYYELLNNETLSTRWFVKNYPKESKSASCNFTTLGGLFQHFNLATYEKRGVYIKK